MKPQGSVVVVTGASSGIGRATAVRLARKGASVVLAARQPEALEAVAQECRDAGGRAIAVPTDVTDEAAVEALAARAVEEFGSLDAWVNCAAVTAFGAFLDIPTDDVRRVLEVNVVGYVLGAKAALRRFREAERGVLVNVASVVSEVPQPYAHAYAMSKAAVRSLSATIRQELLLDGVRDIKIATVMPAAIDTRLFQHGANYTGRRIMAPPPVYTPERVARTIVRQMRNPRRAAIAGGIGGRAAVLQHRLTPGLSERLAARGLDRVHVSRKHTAKDSSGNLYEPAPADEHTAHGGWHGRSRTAARRLATAAALAGGAVAVSRTRGRAG